MADNNLQASFRKLMRYAQNLAEYEQGIAEGIIDENVFVIVLAEKVAKFKGQTFDWSESVEVDLSSLATKDELIEVEEVAAAAFNDLKGIIDNIPSVEVDAELSADSENAIQNKTVTNELNTKVDKVEGKQLSTEDFTTSLKEKLEGLSAFDPTEINNAIEGLQNSFDALVSGNTSAAIESFNEFVAFLSGITDTQTLAGIVASLEQMIAAKQDKINDLDTIRSGAEKGATAIQQVKTINGEEIVGEGNIEINVDTSTLATKEEVTNLINEVIDDEEVLAHSLNELNERVLNIAEELTGDFASKEEFDSALESLSQADTTNQQAISEVSGKVTTLTERVDNIPAELADDFATKEALETSNSNLTNEVIDDEEVLAHALNDLNERLNNIGSSSGSGAVTFYAVVDEGELSEKYKSQNANAFNSYKFGQPIIVVGIAGGNEVSTLFPMSAAYQENTGGESGLSFIACSFPMPTASGSYSAILFYEDGSIMAQL